VGATVAVDEDELARILERDFQGGLEVALKIEISFNATMIPDRYLAASIALDVNWCRNFGPAFDLRHLKNCMGIVGSRNELSIVCLSDSAQPEKETIYADDMPGRSWYEATFVKPTEIIAIDWHVYRKFLLVWAAVLALGIFAAMLLPPGAQVAKGIFLGATLVCPYGFAHFCFVIPRGFGLLKRLCE